MNTRKHILDATRHIIEEKGLARVTTREIAREAGCAEGTLYKHFETKEDLFLAVVQENLPDFAATVREDRAGTQSVSSILEEVALAAIGYYEKLIPLALSFFADAQLLARHREWMCEHKAGPQNPCERVAAYVAAEQRLGRINPNLIPLSIAYLLLGSCFQYVFNRLFLGSNPLPMTDQQFAAGLVQTLVEGVSSPSIA